jgi:gliding motility-associated-like protein
MENYVPKSLLLLLLVLLTVVVCSQPSVTWNTVPSSDPVYSKTNNVGRSVIKTSDGGYITCGGVQFTSDQSNNQRKTDALIIKYSALGVIEWKKNYGGSDDEAAHSIVNTSDGGYLFVGYTLSNDGDVIGRPRTSDQFSDVWVVKLSNTGNLEWQKCLGGSFSEVANAVAATTDGSYVFTGYTDSNDGEVTGQHGGPSDVWVVKLSATGNLLWQKCMGGSKIDEGRSIDLAADGGVIICGRTESNDGDVSGQHGFFDIWIVKLNISGVIEWQKCLGGAREDVGNSVKTTPDGGYIVCGESSSFDGDVTYNHSGTNNLADVWGVKMSKAGTIQWQKTLGGTEFDIGYSIDNDPSGGYIVAAYTYSNDGDVEGNHSAMRDAWITKLDPSGAMQWQKSVGGSYDEIPYSIIPTVDGGYIFTGYTTSFDGDVTGNASSAGGAQTWTVKLGACIAVTVIAEPSDQTAMEGSTASFHVEINGSAPFTYQWYRNNDLIIGATEARYTTPLVSLSEDGDLYQVKVTNCQGANSVASRKALLKVINKPACQENYFVKTYSNTEASAYSTDMIRTLNNDMIICGEIINAPPDLSDGFIFKVDDNGAKLWELSFGGRGSQIVSKMTQLRDGHFLAAGYDGLSSVDGTYFLLKFDSDGNVIWRKDIKFSSSENMGIRKIAEALDGTLVMVAYSLENNLSFNDRLLYFKFDANGNLILSNSFRPNNFTSILYTNDLVIKDGFSYVVGTHLENATNIIKGYLSKIDNNSGALLWTQVYDFNGRPENFLQVFDYGNARLLILGQNDLNSTDTSTVMICDTAGTIQSYTFFQYGLYRQFGNASLDQEGNLLYGNYHTSGGPVDLAMCLVHPVNGVIWSRHYPQINTWPQVSKVIASTDGSIFCSGYMGGIRLYLGKFSSNGEIGCTADVLSTNFGNAGSLPKKIAWLGNPKFFQVLDRLTPVKAIVISEDQTLCTLRNSCTLVSISGGNTICNLADTLKLNISRNEGCLTAPQLQFDTSYFSLVNFSGDEARFVAKQAGQSSISASIYTGCDTLSDTIVVLVSNAPPSLDLGPGRDLCPGNTILLNARSGYLSYEWQNGTSDSTLAVSTPGLYHVTTTDACGTVFKDTIVISAASSIPLNAGPDRSKCNSDTLYLSAPSGFLNYLWSNNYHISSLDSPNVVVSPLMDTAYYLRAEKTPGCFAYDTIRITVNTSPSIDLGSDRQFCSSDSVLLNAGGGFLSYHWNSGNNGQSLTVKSAGDYSVIGITEQGCISYDTMSVLTVFPLPKVELDTSAGLCLGESRNLDAGSFASYLWQDGSTSRSYIARDKGTYMVTVTDSNGCQGNNITTITTIYPLPQRFLPQDTAICSYGKLDLRTHSFYKTYLWNNGAGTPAITISQPGTYWLQVKDNNNCIGKDSIIVSVKQCMSGLYIPTAFTPNGDGKNDVFRPLLFGNVKHFLFTVYNRWGQIVYQTSELQKGWDGKLTGKPQDTNVFIWTCSYQREGEKENFERGTVTLIH